MIHKGLSGGVNRSAEISGCRIRLLVVWIILLIGGMGT